jgi:beta-galactosidase
MKTYIDFDWRFIPGFLGEYTKGLPKNASVVDIPHCPVEVPVSYFDEKCYQKIFTYEKSFDLPSFSKKEKIILTFEAVMLKFHLFVNENDLGEIVSGWVPCSFDITDYVKAKDNRLTVVVSGEEDPHIPPFGKTVDYLTFAGIYRPVYLERLPLTYIKSLHASGDERGHLSIQCEVEGKGNEQKLTYTLSYGGKAVIKSSDNELTIPEPHLWDLDNPHLYTLEAHLSSKDGEDSKTLRIGFRSVRFTPNGFFLNGKKIKLIGLNRHQNYPYVGPALPASAQKEDAEIIKIKCGCNCVRTSHYPQSEDFLTRCDEIGLLVIDEIPGWQYIGKDKAWRDNYYYFLNAMIEKERDHTSLIAYGTRIDESADDDELYTKACEMVHKLDHSRQTLGVRNYKTSHCVEDVYSYNDFSCCNDEHGLDDPSSVKGAKGKPILISEHNGHMYVTKQFDSVSRRLENAKRHLRVIDDAYKYERISGAIGWCAYDYYTHADFGSGDHICHHGVMDMFRNPKASAYAYASEESSMPIMWVANPPLPGDNDESLLKPLFVLTNCDYIELFINDSFIGAFTPDKKDYPNLPHAPILVDDFIGASFKEEKIPRKYHKKLIKILNLAASKGMAHFTKRDYMKYLPTVIKAHLSFSSLSDLYGKYVAGWGDRSRVFTLKGYRDGVLVNTKRYGPSLHFSYRYEAYKQSLLNKETYDVSRVSIKFVDEYGTQLHYANRVISFDTLGPIEVIGPKTVALEGGDISVYVRSLPVKKASQARLIIHTELGDDHLDFSVE